HAAAPPPPPPPDHAHHARGRAQTGTHPPTRNSPTADAHMADAVTAELSKLAPPVADYFAQRRSEFATSLKPYDDLIAAIKKGASGKRYAATEGVFDYMASALGLANDTPAGYQTAANNESDPSPADLDAFLGLLREKGVDVLIYNTQTEGSVPQQLRTAAESAGVPVVEVTETVAPGAKSFEAWQVDQLTALAKALGVAT
ncbi:MAG: zinc/manganese transport system substrate-binding protein, partial [Mycobacterium sp.]|nr:zinc/manganese transport system substrate-binding protein [Mycobacterium sp.]